MLPIDVNAQAEPFRACTPGDPFEANGFGEHRDFQLEGPNHLVLRAGDLTHQQPISLVLVHA